MDLVKSLAVSHKVKQVDAAAWATLLLAEAKATSFHGNCPQCEILTRSAFQGLS